MGTIASRLLLLSALLLGSAATSVSITPNCSNTFFGGAGFELVRKVLRGVLLIAFDTGLLLFELLVRLSLLVMGLDTSGLSEKVRALAKVGVSEDGKFGLAPIGALT